MQNFSGEMYSSPPLNNLEILFWLSDQQYYLAILASQYSFHTRDILSSLLYVLYILCTLLLKVLPFL